VSSPEPRPNVTHDTRARGGIAPGSRPARGACYRRAGRARRSPGARHAALRLRPHARRGERARPAGGVGAHRRALEGPLGAQGAARARGPRARAPHRHARHARVRRPRRLLPGRDTRTSASPAASRPRRSATPAPNVSDRDLDVILESGAHLNVDSSASSTATGGGTAGHHRHPHQSARQCRPPRERHQLLQRRPADQVRDLPRAARRGARRRALLRPHRRHRPLPRQPPPADDDLPAFDRAWPRPPPWRAA